MSTILVEIKTDHNDPDEAVRSVSSGMKRAGYDVLDYDMISCCVVGTKSTGDIILSFSDAYVQVAEPEVSHD